MIYVSIHKVVQNKILYGNLAFSWHVNFLSIVYWLENLLWAGIVKIIYKKFANLSSTKFSLWDNRRIFWYKCLQFRHVREPKPIHNEFFTCLLYNWKTFVTYLRQLKTKVPHGGLYFCGMHLVLVQYQVFSFIINCFHTN